MAKILFFRLGETDRISVFDLLTSLRNILGVLEDLDASISERKSGGVRWEVAVLSKQSPPVIGIEGCPTSIKRPDPTPLIQDAVINGLRELRKVPERSAHYSDSVLEKLRKLAIQAKKLGPLQIYIEENGDKTKERQAATIDNSTYDNIDKMIGVKYKGFGSIVGKLDAIIVHNRDEVKIWDERTGKAVTCYFDREQFFEKMKIFLLKEVIAYGEVSSNQRGEPVSIVIKDIEARTPQEKLPTIKEMSGLVKDMYEGKTLKKYLEEMDED